MHLGAAEAVGVLDKTKWANTTAGDRLRILEKMQVQILEEMEDLGVEEAESKNMKVGTTDNLYAANACRLTAVVPMAFAISSAIDLYKTNLAGKALDPVRKTKVEANGGVDMIDFGVATPDVSQDGEGTLEGEEATEENSKRIGDVTAEDKDNVKKTGDQSPAYPRPGHPYEPPVHPPSDPPPALPSGPLVAPSDPPTEPPSVPPPPPPSDLLPVQSSNPPQPVPSDNGDKDDNKENTEQESSDYAAINENREKTDIMDGTETSEMTERQMNDADLDVSETATDNEASINPTPEATVEDRKIKIQFDPTDEFASLDPDVDPNDLLFHDMLVSPRTWNEKGYFNGRRERLRVQGDPEHRVGPYDRRDPQATAILGASCFSAAAEIIKATFLDGHVVVYKPHPYNADVDKIWAEIMKPLMEVGAVSYCLSDEGPELVQDPRIDQVYMTGSETTGHEIRKLTQKPCVLQTGSVNPVILVPGLDRPWRPKELRHHALQIASAGKFNGGHFCGRPQVIITSKSWDQRDEFVKELETAIAERTPPEGSYDPAYRKKFDRFVQEYPHGNIIEAEDLGTDSARMLVVKGAAHDSYGLHHEAFCQVLIEVALDLPDHPVAFLPDAVKFCNEKLHGSLCATIIIDDTTNKQYTGIVQQALSDLRYGTVATNAMACFGWFNPSLYWGSYKTDKEDAKAKGVGHFGNLMGYENAIKSVITDSFCGSGHFIKTCRGAYAEKIAALSYYALEPNMKKVTTYKYKGVRAAAARKDW